MSYRNLHLTFEALWGDNILKGERSKSEEANLAWRRKMAQRPIEERYAMAEEEYIRLETIEFKKNQSLDIVA